MLNKIKGGVFGHAVGDALGVSVEFMTPAEIQERYGTVTDILGGGMFGFKKGEVSDDTDMLLCVAKGILQNPSFPLEHIGEEFINWRNKVPKDMGTTIRFSLKFYDSTQDWNKSSQMAHDFLGGQSAGNGSLMRTLPIALAYNMLPKIEEISDNQSRMTHFDKEASEACILYNRIAYRLLQNEDLTSSIVNEIKGTPYESVITEKPTCNPDGYVVHTLRWVLHILLNTQNFEEAVQMAVNLGYDADTVAAITGGLAGIYYGYSNIPTRFIDTLLIKKELEEVSERLFEMRNK